MKYYAGIGSRRTPQKILTLMTMTAAWLYQKGWVLRSGGAEGADQAFERGTEAFAKEIWRPEHYLVHPEALPSVNKFHPAPQALSPSARRLMARNYLQIFGHPDSPRSSFVLCWTPDGADGITIPTSRETGGTGQAIRIAARHGVPVLNLKHQEIQDRILTKIASGS